MAKTHTKRKGSAGSSGICLFAASQAREQDVQGGSGGSILGGHQSLPGHPGLILHTAIPILGGWAMSPCAWHGSCAGSGSSLRSLGSPAGTLELFPGQHSSSSSASASWNGRGAPLPERLCGSYGLSCGICSGFGSLLRALATGVSRSSLRRGHAGALESVCHQYSSPSSASGLGNGRGAPFPGSSGVSCGICPGFASFLYAIVWRNQRLPMGVSPSSLRGHRIGALERICHQHSSSSGASALWSARGSLSGCPGLSWRTCSATCPSHGNAPCSRSTCGGPVPIPAGSTTCGTCAEIAFSVRRPGWPNPTLQSLPLQVCPPKSFSAASNTSSSGSRCPSRAATASGHRGATSWISFPSCPRACRVPSAGSGSTAACACSRRRGPAHRGTGPRAGGRGGAWAAGSAGTRPRPGSNPTGTAGRSSAGTSWSTPC